jgi:hypothetical protein
MLGSFFGLSRLRRIGAGLSCAVVALGLAACSSGSSSGHAHFVTVGPVGAPASSSAPTSAPLVTSPPAQKSTSRPPVEPTTKAPTTSAPTTKAPSRVMTKSPPRTSHAGYADIAAATTALQALGPPGHLTVASDSGGYDAAAVADDGYLQLWSERGGQPWHKDVTTTYISVPGQAMQYAPDGATVLLPAGAAYPVFGIQAVTDAGHDAGYPMFADIGGGWQLLVRNEHGDIVGVDASVGAAGLNAEFPYLFDKARVENGILVTEVDSAVFAEAVKGAFPVTQRWKASGSGFEVTGDNIKIAESTSSTIGQLADLSPYLPVSGLPDGVYGADFQGLSENSADHVTIQPIDGTGPASYYDVGTPESIPVSPTVEFHIPVLTADSSTWSFITAPVWLTDMLETPATTGPGVFGHTYQAPYYIPDKLGVTTIGTIVGAARVSISDGVVTGITILPGQ